MKLGDSIELISLSFDGQDIPLTFSSAPLGSVLMILQRTQKNIPLLICSSSDFLSRVLVTDRETYENDILDPSCQLLKSVIAALNERVARIQFQKVTHNEAQFLTNEPGHLVELDTPVDVTFENPGMLLWRGSQ
jgi:hypothetical protein